MIHPPTLFLMTLVTIIFTYIVCGMPVTIASYAYVKHNQLFDYYNEKFKDCQFKYSNCLNNTTDVYNSMLTNGNVFECECNKSFFKENNFYNGVLVDKCTFTNISNQNTTVETCEEIAYCFLSQRCLSPNGILTHLKDILCSLFLINRRCCRLNRV